MEQPFALPLSNSPAARACVGRSESESQASAAQHERAKFEELYREHYALIGSYLLRRTGDRHVTEDLLSEVFLSSFKGLARYADRGAPVRRWLYRIATNAANQWLRRERRRPRAAGELQELPAPQCDDHARADLIAQVQRLDTRFQDVLLLHYVEGLSLEEVGAVLSLRTGAVKSRLSRARRALRSVLERPR